MLVRATYAWNSGHYWTCDIHCAQILYFHMCSVKMWNTFRSRFPLHPHLSSIMCCTCPPTIGSMGTPHVRHRFLQHVSARLAITFDFLHLSVLVCKYSCVQKTRDYKKLDTWWWLNEPKHVLNILCVHTSYYGDRIKEINFRHTIWY